MEKSIFLGQEVKKMKKTKYRF